MAPVKHPPLWEEERLRREYLEQGLTIKEIAARIGCHHQSVRTALEKYGITKKCWQVWDENWMRREYVERGRTTLEIASELGCGRNTVSRALNRYKLLSPPYPELFDKEWLIREYVDKKRTQGQIAHQLGCAQASVRYALVRYQIKTRPQRSHGRSSSPLYRLWTGMRRRCDDPNHKSWENYGGRGITVCARWKGPNGFANFLADMGERPEWADGGIDRIDVDGNYEPSNCRWATKSQQAKNRRAGYRGMRARPRRVV